MVSCSMFIPLFSFSDEYCLVGFEHLDVFCLFDWVLGLKLFTLVQVGKYLPTYVFY